VNFLTLENITKSYGEKLLFQNISLHIDKGQKIGLIAKNGTGKTRSCASSQAWKARGRKAKILLRKGIRIGWLDQEPNFAPGLDVLVAVLDPTNPLVRVVQRYEKALLHHENPEAKLQDSRVTAKAGMIAEMDHQNAWTFEAKVKETLSVSAWKTLNKSQHTLRWPTKATGTGQNPARRTRFSHPRRADQPPGCGDDRVAGRIPPTARHHPVYGHARSLFPGKCVR
jgi:ATP-binding cassette subfamily F protein uup